MYNKIDSNKSFVQREKDIANLWEKNGVNRKEF